jgi:hypothetical protein
MLPLQGTMVVLALLALALAPWLVARALRWDKANAVLPVVMTGQQATARHLYGEAHGWATYAMRNYDELPAVREPWEQAAEERLARK